MASNEEMREKMFTKEGIEIVDNKIKSMVDLFNKNKFPINEKMWGFSNLEIETRGECFNRVKELCQILGAEYSLETHDDGPIKKEVLIY